ncbi:polyprenyl synthetase family protein [Streptomyces sp. Go-475]|uniref:polyprenyl synthetase family protein n=1 Tax=Streptomyces sp. Go-475 TaxID=2072505 RepID=UPI001E2EA6C1|nr:polyprenyl synthetase family protein [Streptomyces sp. Go-475]
MTAVEDTTQSLNAGVLRQQVMERVERRLAELLRDERNSWHQLNPDSVELIDCVADMVASGGKRLRPAFCVSGYLAAGGSPDSAAIVDVAAALELLHTFALLHDDVMDGSQVRRNAPTAHVRHSELHRRRSWKGEARRYGESVAVLAGNLASVFANRLVAGSPPQVAAVWGELCSELMMGQFLDIRAAARCQPDADLARWIARFKSGRYTIQRPLWLGAALAGNTALSQTFEEYGSAVGEAFQLRDDLLDAFGDPRVTGKPNRLDFAGHKMTLLMCFAMADEPSIATLMGDDWSAVAPQELYDLLVEHRVHERVEALIEKQVEAAQAAVRDAGLAPGWAEELTAMAVSVAYRDC